MQEPGNMDGQIQDALARDDAAALDMIWDAYASRLFAFAVALLCSHHDAEEVVQNVFLKIARNHPRVANACSLKAYLFTMARNEAMTLLRKHRLRETSVDPSDLWLVPAEPLDAPSAEAAEATALLARLSSAQREVIVLKFFRDMTFDEIAGSLGISLNTAASRYRYGMEKLRRLMKGGRP